MQSINVDDKENKCKDQPTSKRIKRRKGTATVPSQRRIASFFIIILYSSISPILPKRNVFLLTRLKRERGTGQNQQESRKNNVVQQINHRASPSERKANPGRSESFRPFVEESFRFRASQSGLVSLHTA